MNNYTVMLFGLVAMMLVSSSASSGTETSPVQRQATLDSNGENEQENKDYASALSKWQEAISRFVAEDETMTPMSGGVLFTGSSTARLWNVERWFPERVVLNRGFGGSQFSDLVFFANQIIGKHKPDTIVVYSGDNDIHGGKTPQKTAADYVKAVEIFCRLAPKSRIIVLAIKPSQARWNSYPAMREANALMKAYASTNDKVAFLDLGRLLVDASGEPVPECYLRDNLHLSEEGYRRWSEALEKAL